MVKGDLRVAQISAASIIAKVIRDQEMEALDKQYPQLVSPSTKVTQPPRILLPLSSME